MGRTALSISALTLLSILVTGYCVYCDGHALEIPLVLELQDSDLFPADPFVETLAFYPSVVWWLVSLASRVVDLEIVLGLGFLLMRVLLIASAVRLGRALVPDSQGAAWAGAALLALGPRALVGSGTTVEVFFEQSGLFMPFFLFALAFLLEGRAVLFAIVWGLGFIINPMYGLWAGAIFAGTWIVDPGRGPWQAFARAAPIFVLMTAPILWQSLSAMAGEPPDHYTWIWINRMVHSIHLFPETWDRALFGRFFAFLALLVASGWAARPVAPRLGRLTSVWAFLGLAFLGLAYLSVATEWRALITLHPARATDPLYLCGAVAIVVSGTSLAARRSAWAVPLVFAAIFSLTVYLLVPGISPRALAVAVLAAALATGVVRFAVRRPENRSRAASALAIGWFVGLTLWIASGAIASRAEEKGGIVQALYTRPPSDIQRLAAWAKQNTPRDAVFFHDPVSWDWSQFRHLAARPVFVTWKDASGVLWHPPYAGEWSKRFVAFGFNHRMRRKWDPRLPETEDKLRRALRFRYRLMQDKDLRPMRAKYRIDYWIAPIKAESRYPVVFEVDRFKVFDLTPR